MTLSFIKEEETPGCYIKARFVLVIMSALGTLNVYILRNAINIAIVAMVKNQKSVVNSSYLTSESECQGLVFNFTYTEELHQNGEFDWTVTDQTLILGSFYYGYFITNIPGAWLSKRFGFKAVIGLTSLICAIITSFTPIIARMSFGLLVVLRVVTGLLQGVTFPSLMTAWGAWAPPLERSRMVSVSVSGASCGYFAIYILGGFIVSAYGWEATFYVAGLIGLLWSSLWLFIVHNAPAVHPRISKQEREYIQNSIHGKKIRVSSDKAPIPWFSILKSVPVWAAVSAHLADNWTTFSLGMLIPTYLARVHGLNTQLVGVLSAIPFAIKLVTSVVGSYFADLVLMKQWASIIVVRKTATVLPLISAGVSLIALAYLNCSTLPAIVFVCFISGILGLTTSGHESTFVDIAPRYGGIIYSISNSLSSILGFVGPQVAGAMLADNPISGWSGVFWLAAVICLLGSLTFFLFATDQVQLWAKYERNNEMEMETAKLIEEVESEEEDIFKRDFLFPITESYPS